MANVGKGTKMPLVSIVMSYYNRLEQLDFTLQTIQQFSGGLNVEVVIVDDGSDKGKRAQDACNRTALSTNCIYVPRNKRTWLNPCAPFNMGFKAAKGEIIIIQNPECFHVGHIINHVIRNVKDNYLVYSVKKLNANVTRNTQSCWRRAGFIEEFKKSCKNVPQNWYCHSKFNPTGYHFIAAIKKVNLQEFGGFDERYANGYSFDDDEFLTRMKRSPYEVVLVPPDECFGVHQFHTSTHPPAGNKDAGWKRNYQLFHNSTKKETTWRANVV